MSELSGLSQGLSRRSLDFPVSLWKGCYRCTASNFHSNPISIQSSSWLFLIKIPIPSSSTESKLKQMFTFTKWIGKFIALRAREMKMFALARWLAHKFEKSFRASTLSPELSPNSRPSHLPEALSLPAEGESLFDLMFTCSHPSEARKAKLLHDEN